MNVAAPSPNSLIRLAIMAVGGQGGGVLTGWIETLARAHGYTCQATSVAGVAQRTGATIYYIEMAPTGSNHPVFSLAPAAGDVDIVIAAEMMEAGRAILRGFVTPDKTTLIASTHRALAISEKMVPGDGVSNPQEVLAAIEIAAARFHCLDMQALAVANGSAISSTLFGALSASGCLPFPKDAFRDAIRSDGKGVDASLRAFDAAFDACLDDAPTPQTKPDETPQTFNPTGSKQQLEHWEKLLQRATEFPEPALPLVLAGLRKAVDFMDLDYGSTYLDHLVPFHVLDGATHGFELTKMAAKYIANGMAYDDVIKVADLKTRRSRADRIAVEMRADATQVMKLTEYLHPRAAEIVGMFPVKMGRRLEANPRAMDRIDRWFGKGRRLRSDRLFPFLMLYAFAGLKRYRRRTYRQAVEHDHLQQWMQLALDQAPQNYALATEILCCRRLIKGYSDTHSRGLSKFDKTLDALDLVKDRPDAADWLRRLRDAALQDEKGDALAGAIKTIKAM